VGQFKAFCQFENRYVRDVRIRLVAEDFLEKQNVLEYFSCSCFLVTPNHRDLRIDQKTKALHRVTVSTFARLEATLPMTAKKQRLISFAKDFLATVLFLILTSGLRIKASRPARKFSIEVIKGSE
jgi:hypothetical protein